MMINAFKSLNTMPNTKPIFKQTLAACKNTGSSSVIYINRLSTLFWHFDCFVWSWGLGWGVGWRIKERQDMCAQ